MSEINYFAPPIAESSDPYSETPPGSGNRITPLMVSYLKKTKPWVFMMSILGLGFGSMCLFGGLAFSIFLGLSGASADSGGSDTGLAGAILVGFIYAVLGAIYLVPSVILLRFGLSRSKVGSALNDAAFALALRRQRSFWRTLGLMTIAAMVLYFVFLALIASVGMFQNL